jgi:hypothetical protein
MTVQPVERAAPDTGEVLRRGRDVGLGALGLARHGAARIFARVPASRTEAEANPVSMVPGAIVGMAIATERVARIVAEEVVARTSAVARVVTRPPVVRSSLRPAEDLLWHFNEIARREQERNEAEAAALIPIIIQQVTENVIAQLDLVSIVQQVPVDDIVAGLDIEAIVARVDLGGVIRESTAGLTAEAIEAVRDQSMAIDSFASAVVDRLLFRKRPRRLELGGNS